ncbi:hypothetical protein ACFW2V_13330 [Streptomyces sp. NPDC058947]|uniref:hypothetical protein n=1 Tax=Streptomyces sp. NPDC058947 TaxID=3346675 RepID=UPI0036889024
MSRHFTVEVHVTLPGEDDAKEEADLAALLEAIGNLPEFQTLHASVEEPYRT